MKRALFIMLFTGVYLVCILAQSNSIPLEQQLVGKTFYKATSIDVSAETPKLYIQLSGRCSFLLDGTIRFEKISRPTDPPQKTYKILDYQISDNGLSTFVTINKVHYWLQNSLPNVFTCIEGHDFGKGEEYSGSRFYLIDVSLIDKLASSPAYEDDTEF